MTDSDADFSGLSALYLNCTLKRSPERSHTRLLLEVPAALMRSQGVDVEIVRAADFELAPGVQPDMTEEGHEHDGWPELWARVRDADIVVLGTPIWLGARSSVCTRVVERLYAMSGMRNARGQYVYYGKVGGCVVTGNEDGAKHVAAGLLYALQHLGLAIPPQADTGWLGPIGPGPSYGDEADDGSRVGFDNDYTRRTATFMAWNLMHLARMMKAQGGFPSEGNRADAWEDGERFGYENPEYR